MSEERLLVRRKDVMRILGISSYTFRLLVKQNDLHPVFVSKDGKPFFVTAEVNEYKNKLIKQIKV
jgi:hypothetical protein